jgi:hypothetical protein
VPEAIKRISIEERRARLALRHHLASEARVETAVEVARSLVGLHGTDPASVYLAASARMSAPEFGEVERALYEERELVRILGMRRTMFVLPKEVAGVVQAACSNAIAMKERRKLVQLLEQAGLGSDASTWLNEVQDAVMSALVARGEALAAELSKEVPELRQQLVVGRGTKWEAPLAVSTRILFLLAAEGRIIRGRPGGSWTSSQYRWTTLESWLPEGLTEWPLEAAQAELTRRWLAAFGPGTASDLKWWTGWTATEVKRALGRVGPVEVELDGERGFVLEDDVDRVATPGPWVALLPSLDPTVMGWYGRRWYLGEHGSALFDRSGNAGPTVWCDGKVIGGWAQRRDGAIVFRLLEEVGGETASAVEAAVEALSARLPPPPVTPRFRTPLERELSA